MNRLRDVERFYAILGELEARTGPFPHLRECHGRMKWPARGVYFFFEAGEERSTSGVGPRVVRIGTHALTTGSGTTLWNRLSQHRGPAKSGSGNHRGSVFRLLVGEALMKRRGTELKTWGLGGSASDAARAGGMERDAVREQERSLEVAVSETIGAMQIAWIQVDDPPGTTSARGTIERNAIGILSNWSGPPMDPASSGWLGKSCDHERVPRSGLWNNNHVEEAYDSTFLDQMARAVAVVGQVSRYLGWIQSERKGERAVGAIIARDADPKLRYAVQANDRLSLWRFDDELRVRSA